MLLAGDSAAGDVVVAAKNYSVKSLNIAVGKKLLICNGRNGMLQWDITIPKAGKYYIHSYYASGASRPLRLTINRKQMKGDFFANETGGWGEKELAWDTIGPFDFKKGKNTIKVSASGNMPHLGAMVISENEKKWARQAALKDLAAPRKTIPKNFDAMKGSMAANRQKLRKKLGCDEVVFIKRYTYTANHYYTEFINSKWLPGGGIFILSLKDGTERQIASELKNGVFGRLDISFDAKKVVFDWKSSHDSGYRIYEVGIDGRGLRQVLEAPANEAELVKKYRRGYHHGTDDMHPCYLPDGGFAFVSTRCKSGTLCDGWDSLTTAVLHRMNADGSKLKQLSFGALSEFTPTVLPDGRILYARWEYVDKGIVAAKCIWAMRPDGTASSEVYGNNISFPTTMIQARAIPNASGKYVILGCPHYPQNSLGTVIRIDMNKPIRTAAPMDHMTPYVKILTEAGWHFRDDKTGEMRADRTGQGPLFRDPYPLDKDNFMVAHKPVLFGRAYETNGYGLYMLDSAGKTLPFYHDSKMSSWQPMPLSPRKRPPELSSLVDPDLAKRNLARCIVVDVHHGLENTKRGSIKFIRVLEQIPRPWSARRHPSMKAQDIYGQQHAVVSKDTALGLKVQHGVVPVEKDGSAHFLVPANANIFFQALDENYLAMQTERTFVNYMPGEVRSCIGCHETPRDVPTVSLNTLASRKAPAPPGPQIGEKVGRRALHYPSDVQPVLDKHCIKCHNAEKKKGGLDLTGTMTTLFSASYENLLPDRRRGRKEPQRTELLPTIGELFPKTGNVVYLPARSLGSHNSLLMAMLMPDAIKLTGDKTRMDRLKKLVEQHKKLKLAPEELLKISNWVDTNAQYYGSYYGRRNIKDKAHPNFRPAPSWTSARGIPPLPEKDR